MELYNLINIYSERFVPVFIRVAILFTFIPFIGGKSVPMIAKIGLMLAFTLLFMPVVNIDAKNQVRAVLDAVFIGFALGLCYRLIASVMEMAAQWISLQMGFGIAGVFNPQFGEVLGPVSLLYSLITLVLFFMLDIHHYFIEAIALSFTSSQLAYNNIFEAVVKFSSMIFPLALKIAVPVILIQALINIGMGFLSRAMPQANIFFISFPVLIFIGLLVMAISMPITITIFSNSFMHFKDAIRVFLR
ncbi:MAG: flagellar biosynthetic protein FliR [Nitrospiraceae bacterium]|nr:flagellar biosynthetic protein FliR [Nitrospiraceae bacterium]